MALDQLGAAAIIGGNSAPQVLRVEKSPKNRSPESPKDDVLAAALRHRGSTCRRVSTSLSETQPDQPWARKTSAPPAERPCPRGSPAPPGPPRARSGHCR